MVGQILFRLVHAKLRNNSYEFFILVFFSESLENKKMEYTEKSELVI